MAHIEITTSIGCPPACSICPQKPLVQSYSKHDPGAKYRLMTFDMFRQCLEKVPKHYDVAFSGMSEPFTNPECMDMIRYSVQSGRRVHLFTTLIGLSSKDASLLAKLIKSNSITRTVIHLPDANGMMKGFMLTSEYIQNLLLLLPLKNVSSMCMSEKSEVDPNLLSEIQKIPAGRSLYHKLPRVPFIAHSRAGNLKNKIFKSPFSKQTNLSTYAVTCSKTPYYDEPVLLPDGTLLLCCQDYSLTHRLGNLADSNYESIRTSAEFSFIVSSNSLPLLKDKPGTLCHNCEFACHWTQKDGKWIKINENSFSRLLSIFRQKLKTAVRYIILRVKSR